MIFLIDRSITMSVTCPLLGCLVVLFILTVYSVQCKVCQIGTQKLFKKRNLICSFPCNVKTRDRKRQMCGNCSIQKVQFLLARILPFGFFTGPKIKKPFFMSINKKGYPDNSHRNKIQ